MNAVTLSWEGWRAGIASMPFWRPLRRPHWSPMAALAAARRTMSREKNRPDRAKRRRTAGFSQAMRPRPARPLNERCLLRALHCLRWGPTTRRNSASARGIRGMQSVGYCRLGCTAGCTRGQSTSPDGGSTSGLGAGWDEALGMGDGTVPDAGPQPHVGVCLRQNNHHPGVPRGTSGVMAMDAPASTQVPPHRSAVLTPVDPRSAAARVTAVTGGRLAPRHSWPQGKRDGALPMRIGAS
jgi:hypothetical protein